MKLLKKRNFVCVLSVLLGLSLAAPSAFAEGYFFLSDIRPSFSIDVLSPTVGTPASDPIHQADILIPGPTRSTPFFDLGLASGDELDALSFGFDFSPSDFFDRRAVGEDHQPVISEPLAPGLYFSVDRGATGLPTTAVETEATTGGEAASGDVFSTPTDGTNSLAFDETDDLGLAVDVGVLSDEDDDLDALELDPDVTPLGVFEGSLSISGPVFYSLAPGSPTLTAIGATPGDILFSLPGVGGPISGPGIAVLGTALGLGPGDNLDALILDVFAGPFSGGGVLFSVDAATAASLPGIAEGDLLAPGPTGPTVVRTAADLGLAPTDELNALDIVTVHPDPQQPILFPDVINPQTGAFEFLDVPVSDVVFTFFDPVVAIGYDYEVLPSDPLMTEVVLPVLPFGDNLYDLFLFAAGLPVDTGIDLIGGLPFDLTSVGPGGVAKFGIRGIELPGLDPSDPLAFVTGLTFAGAATASLTMTPITTSTDPIPEPSTFVLFGIGLLSVVGYGWRRRKRLVT